MKKLFALICLAALCLSMSFPAVASSGSSGQANYTGETIVPTVDVTIVRIDGVAGTGINFILNPYGVELNQSNGTWISQDGDTSQVNSAPVWIQSNTLSGVSAAVKDAQLLITGDITAVTKPITGATATKNVFVFLDMETMTETSSTTPDTPEFPDYGNASNQLVLTATANTKAVTLATLNPIETSGEYQWACLRACGNATSKFTDNSTVQWAESDNVDVSYTFVFRNAMPASE